MNSLTLFVFKLQNIRLTKGLKSASYVLSRLCPLFVFLSRDFFKFYIVKTPIILRVEELSYLLEESMFLFGIASESFERVCSVHRMRKWLGSHVL